MAPYLKLDPAPADVDLVRDIWKTWATNRRFGVEPDLEVL
jgi:hypothetical protein